MKILLVADGRSPTTRRWLEGLLAQGHKVFLVSSYPCEPPSPSVEIRVLPIAFGNLAKRQAVTGNLSHPVGSSGSLKRIAGRFRPLFLTGRYLLGPASLDLSGAARRFNQLVSSWQPDLVHALRIPFEGMLAGRLPNGLPLIVSIWGNDLTLHARGSPWMASQTRRCLHRTDGLIADAARDLRLAHSWGYPSERPTLVVPGSGGIDLEEIERCKELNPASIAAALPRDLRWVINPRGLRPGSLRTDVFFKSIPLVLEQEPHTAFICPGMAGQDAAIHWVKQLGIEKHVYLLPTLPQPDIWAMFHQAQIYISPSIHDGTPNSFLEALACGCFPVVGDIESFREWISPGVTGLLVDATDPSLLARATIQALQSPVLRSEARMLNAKLVADRASKQVTAQKIEDFYRFFVQS